MNREDAIQKYNEAQRLWEARRFTAALAMVEELLREFPDNGDLARLHAQCIASIAHDRQSGIERRRRGRRAVLIVGVLSGMAVAALFIVSRLPKSREIPFPEEFSLGRVYVREAGAPTEAWADKGEARGTMTVPVDAAVRLKLDGGEFLQRGLDAFSAFPPDALQEIEAARLPVDNEGLLQIARMRGLQSLDLEGTAVDDVGISFLADLTALHSLSLATTSAGDKGMIFLAGLPNLEHLDLRDTSVTDKGIESLAALRRLRSFHAPRAITDVALGRISEIATLEELDLSYTGITDRGLRRLKNLGGLRTLNLKTTWTGDSGASHLADMKSLEDLNLAHTRITDEGIGRIATLPALRNLVLDGTRVTGEAIAHLSNAAALARLGLGACFDRPGITNESLNRIAALPLLDALDISGARLTNDSVEALSKLRVTSLELGETGLDEAALAKLRANLPRCSVTASPRAATIPLNFPPDVPGSMLWIRPSGSTENWTPRGKAQGRIEVPPAVDLRLDIPVDSPGVLEGLRAIPAEMVTSLRISKASPITADDLGAIARFTRLEAIAISGPEVSPGALTLLGPLPLLKRIDLASLVLDPQSVLALPRFASVESLDLGRARFDLETWRGAGPIAPLRNLSLQGVPLQDADAVFLQQWAGLTQLDLTGTGLPETAVAALQAALPNCALRYTREARRVIKLDAPAAGALWTRDPGDPADAWQFAGTFPGELAVTEGAELRVDVDPGVESFSWLAVLANEGIHTLNLAGTQFKDKNLSLLPDYKNLKALDLHGAAIGDAELGRIALLEGLESLKLGSTKVTDDGVTLLAPLTGLREVDLSNTAVTGAALETLVSLPALERVYLEGAAVTVDAVAEAQAALPGCEFFAGKKIPSRRGPVAVAPAARVLHLSSTRPMGTLWMRDWKGGPWEELGPLCCEVPIPAKKALRLVVSLEALPDLSPLAELPPDTFDEIALEPGAVIEEATLLALSHHATLKSLSLARAEIRPGALKQIQAFTAMKRLSLRNSRMDPRDLAYLRMAPWIEDIDISGVSLGDDALAHLGAISALKSVDMRGNPQCSDNALSHWNTLASLDQVDLSRTAVSDILPRRIEALPSLKTLYAYGTQITQSGRERMAGMALTKAEFERARLTEADLDEIAPTLSSAVRNAGGITRASLAAVANVAHVRDLDEGSLMNLARQAMRSMTAAGIAVDSKAISEIAGTDSLDALPAEERRGLQRAAFDAIAGTGKEISVDDLASVSGVETPADIPAAELDGLRRTAMEAMAGSSNVISRDTITGLLGTEAVDSANAVQQDEVRTMVLSAMANSGQGITPEVLAAVEGVVSSDEIVPERLAVLHEESLSAMAASDTGLTSTRLAALDGATTLGELSEERIGALQTLALSAMAASDTGIDAKGLAAIGGAETIGELAPVELASLQQMALSAMTDSDTGITAESLADLSGVDSLSDLAEDERSSLQGMALSAMADSGTISDESIVAISGMGSMDAIPENELNDLRALTLSAMAGSETGLKPELIASFIGDAAIDDVTFADSPIHDGDLAMLPNLGAIRRIDLSRCKNITDAALSRLQGASALETLLLAGTNITDAGLALAGMMTSLRTLDVSRTAITDAGLVHLGELGQLSSLSLEGTNVSGSGLEQLRGLVSLRTLDLRETFVWDRHLRHLGRLTSIDTLRLAFTPVGDAGLASLNGLSALRTLELHYCPLVTDAGIKDLEALPGITRLTLYGASVTGACAESIKTISALEQFVVSSTTFTPSAVVDIESALPRCEVVALPAPPLDAELFARIDRGVSLRNAAIAATRTPPESFRSLSYLDMAARLAYAGAVLGAALLSAFVPFLPYLSRLNPLARSARGLAIAARLFREATRITAIVGYLLTRAGLSAVRWWILATVVAILAYLLYSGLDFGWLRLNDTLPVPIR